MKGSLQSPVGSWDFMNDSYWFLFWECSQSRCEASVMFEQEFWDWVLFLCLFLIFFVSVSADPLSMSPQKALETIGANLQKQYENWQPRVGSFFINITSTYNSRGITSTLLNDQILHSGSMTTDLISHLSTSFSHPSIYISSHTSIYPSIHQSLSFIYQFISSIHQFLSSVHPSIHPLTSFSNISISFIHPSIGISISCDSIYQFLSFIHFPPISLTHPSIYFSHPSILSPVLLIHEFLTSIKSPVSFIYPSFHRFLSSIHPSIHKVSHPSIFPPSFLIHPYVTQTLCEWEHMWSVRFLGSWVVICFTTVLRSYSDWYSASIRSF